MRPLSRSILLCAFALPCIAALGCPKRHASLRRHALPFAAFAPACRKLSSTPNLGPLDVRKYIGVTHVTQETFSVEVGRVMSPVMVLFHHTKDSEVVAYATSVANQVSNVNMQLAQEAIAAAGGDADMQPQVAVKLCLVNVLKEPDLALQFQAGGNMFPIIFYCHKGRAIDKLIGMVGEVHIRETILSLLKYAKETDEKEGGPSSATIPQRPNRLDEDDENVVTLINVAIQKARDKEYGKAEELFKKALKIAEAEVSKLKLKHGLDKRKMTPEIHAAMKKDAHVLAIPQARVGLAMVAMSRQKLKEAAAICKSVREEYPWAASELKTVAESLTRVEIMDLAELKATDNMIMLLRDAEHISDAVCFYKNQVKLAALLFFEHKSKAALTELLRIIRSEAKMLPQLREGGVVGPDAPAGQNTPARRCLFLMFEALGNHNEDVVAARKSFAAFT